MGISTLNFFKFAIASVLSSFLQLPSHFTTRIQSWSDHIRRAAAVDYTGHPTSAPHSPNTLIKNVTAIINTSIQLTLTCPLPNHPNALEINLTLRPCSHFKTPSPSSAQPHSAHLSSTRHPLRWIHLRPPHNIPSFFIPPNEGFDE